MAIKRAVPKFRRATPAVRREALVEATLRCLKQYGHEGVSVRRISAAAGVSIGLINHHFPSKSGLVAVAYEMLALSLQDSIRAQADNKAVSPRDRLSGLLEQHRARITFRINRMTKTRRQTMLAAEHLEALLQPHAAVEFREHLLDAVAGAAVNWTRERAQRREY